MPSEGTERRVSTSITCPLSILMRAQEAAREKGESISAIVTEALQQYLGKSQEKRD